MIVNSSRNDIECNVFRAASLPDLLREVADFVSDNFVWDIVIDPDEDDHGRYTANVYLIIGDKK